MTKHQIGDLVVHISKPDLNIPTNIGIIIGIYSGRFRYLVHWINADNTTRLPEDTVTELKQHLQEFLNVSNTPSG